MEVRSKILRDRAQNPIEMAAYWTEFVLRNDISPLKPMNDHLTWYQRRLLDVYAVYGLIVLVLLAILILITKCVVKSLIRSLTQFSTRTKQKAA